MAGEDDFYSTEIDDLVMIPTVWIPPDILRLIKTHTTHDSVPVHDFYTPELGSNANFYYIDKRGRLVFKNISMYVLCDSDNNSSMVMNTKHQAVIEPLPEKVYSVINDKFCTLELLFEDGILKQVKSQL